ncbi:NmrA family NAD(P)-binding protein [Actinoplanes sp. NPDC051861]|uniref:NmrA family NAD(P)-binding protein n=1 Tax=Actinoplanes sp. NPDC051861 TaxID=3155170 RepID=UPI00341664DA
MYAITGTTGHVGGATARALRAAGEPVRQVVRDARKAGAWSEAAVADLTDRAALAKAFAGCRGAFVLLPTLPDGGDAEHRAMGDAIAGAVADSGIPHVVMLSSWGADLAEGTGPIRWLHHLENRLRGTGAVVTAIRAPHFQEKAEDLLGPAAGAGVYPVFADTANVPVPMVATRDIGEAVAAALTNPPAASEVVDLDAPAYTERQVAEILGGLLGRDLQVVTLPQPAWAGTLAQAGVPPVLAGELVALYDAGNQGLLEPRGDRRQPCTTELDETLRDVVRAARTS